MTSRVPQFQAIKGDITRLKVDTIVNAANTSLLGGGGVDGAIHRAAGPALLEECQHLNGCDTGDAKITKGYDLPAHHVIHTVGPIWHQHSPAEADRLLLNCYFNSLNLCFKNGLQSIAFSGISTGVYGFPKARAVQLVIPNVIKYCRDNPGLTRVIFCCFDDESKRLYEDALARFL